MAVQFAPRGPGNFLQTLGEALGTGLEGLGTGLGSGLGQGMQLLAQQKLNALQQRQNISRIGPAYEALGFTPEEATSIAGLPEGIQKEIVSQKIKAPQQAAYLNALQSLFGGAPTTEGQAAPGAQAALGALANIGGGLNERQATELTKLALQQQASQRKEKFQREQFTEKQKASAFKETKPERTEILNTAKSAKDSIKRLDRMQELSREGKLSNPLYLKTLEKIGLDIPALKTPQSQEFEKLSVDFLRDAKNIFGSRVTNLDVSTFLKGIPTLSQSPEGRERVIRNLKLFNEGSVIREQALKEVIAENNGIPPLDVASKVEEKAAPQLDQLASEFKKGERATLSAGQQITSLPDPSSSPVNAIIKNNKTGKRFQNTGTEWKEI